MGRSPGKALEAGQPWQRDGAALYTSSTVALDPDTGKLKWYYSHAPGESLDLDEVFERVLIDHGAQKTLMTIGKVGILWKLDRTDGKFLDYKETVLQNVFTHIDPRPECRPIATTSPTARPMSGFSLVPAPRAATTGRR